jgi:AcrR family transcriptional regulator
MSPRKVVDHELSREVIIEAARSLFVQHGYQHTSMRQIAKQLNYSHGAIYYHFKNKAELFYAMVDQDFLLLNEVLDSVLKKEMHPEEKIRKILLRFIEFGVTHSNHYEMMFLLKDEVVKSYFAEGPNKSYEKFASSLYVLCEKKINLKDIWSIFLSLHGFVAHYCRIDQLYDDIKEMAEAHVDFMMQSILLRMKR